MTHTTATYAGLDVSLKETAICSIDETGKVLFEGKVATDPQVIAQCLAKRAPGLSRVGLESGPTSAWLWRELRQLGLPVICLDSRHAHRVLSMKRNKNDRNDARGLAELVRMGWYREARVRSIDAQYVRALLQSRQQLLQARRNIEKPDSRDAQSARCHDRSQQGARLCTTRRRVARPETPGSHRSSIQC